MAPCVVIGSRLPAARCLLSLGVDFEPQEKDVGLPGLLVGRGEDSQLRLLAVLNFLKDAKCAHLRDAGLAPADAGR